MKTILILTMMLSGLAETALSVCVPDGQNQNWSAIEVTIATGGGPYGPVKESFRVGERVPLVITMTNTGSEAVYVCESDMLYQDRPLIEKDGRSISYMPFRQEEVLAAERNKACEKLNLPDKILLRPEMPTVVDWYVLVEGTHSIFDDGWYDPLPAGNYTVSMGRRMSCCDGPFYPTNSVTFLVGQ